MYVFFCQMPKTKARSGAFQKGAYVRSNRRQGHVALHHFETTHYCECIGHYKKRHTHAPFMNPKMGIMSKEKDFLREHQRELAKICVRHIFYLFTVDVVIKPL